MSNEHDANWALVEVTINYNVVIGVNFHKPAPRRVKRGILSKLLNFFKR